MRAAQVALAVLNGVLIVAATALFLNDENAPAWIFAGFGLFGFVCLLAMIVTDAAPNRRNLLPPPQ